MDKNPKPKIEQIARRKETPSSTQTARATLALRELLVQGRFRPGERIREVPLAAQLKVSRIPLHLALERLAHEGFLEIRPTRGFVVQSFTTEDIYDAIELRGLLEGAAARLVTERLRDHRELEPMRTTSQEIITLVRARKLTIETFNRYIELNAKFHSVLLDLSRSRMLRRAIEQACSLPFASPSAFLNRQYISSELHELFLISADQHCAIVEAIANREGMRAEILTREHARVARRNLEDALKNREPLYGLAGAKLVQL
ncbi:MAG TPA: GntR family transcriptional regulator [Bryobacteraceae bacterium]|nr:GntR family transcriptional regulator [Bryobacteraceae bacterium]